MSSLEFKQLKLRIQQLEDRLRDTNQAIIDVDKHKDSFDKLRVAHRLNSEALSNKSPQGK